MKSNSIKKFTAVAVCFVILATSMTSCNRGSGCPYEMKAIVKIVTPIIIK